MSSSAMSFLRCICHTAQSTSPEYHCNKNRRPLVATPDPEPTAFPGVRARAPARTLCAVFLFENVTITLCWSSQVHWPKASTCCNSLRAAKTSDCRGRESSSLWISQRCKEPAFASNLLQDSADGNSSSMSPNRWNKALYTSRALHGSHAGTAAQGRMDTSTDRCDRRSADPDRPRTVVSSPRCQHSSWTIARRFGGSASSAKDAPLGTRPACSASTQATSFLSSLEIHSFSDLSSTRDRTKARLYGQIPPRSSICSCSRVARVTPPTRLNCCQSPIPPAGRDRLITSGEIRYEGEIDLASDCGLSSAA
mmetsp:Transcript_18374/g.44275  ORF Transcript_18374/g.44275 Transcript_18374/m.44275 type:complete len:309 (+) Transcript_18374:313-1239(+)